MKFTHAWAEIASQNLVLKIGLASSAGIALILAFCCAKLALEEPLIVERSCIDQVLSTADSKHSATEIERFVRLSLEERFNTKSVAYGYLSSRQVKFKTDEQQKLTSANMRQVIIVNEMKITEQKIEVNADRLISVGTIRSAFPFPLQVKVATTSRTAENPYGLILEDALPINQEEKK